MKLLTKTLYNKWVLFAGISLFIFSSCRKEITLKEQQAELASVANNSNNKNKIFVSNIEQLYAAINNPVSGGSIIVLSPGTYILNASYPNGGRLELLENMELKGQPGHPELVIIDASALPGASFVPPNNFPAARTGAIRMGRGFNSIEWVTVKGNSTTQALSVIDTDLIGSGECLVRVAHTIVTGGRIGIDIRNTGLISAGRIIEADIFDNELTENLVEFGQGMVIQNTNGATGGIIRVTLNGNNIHGNKTGIRAHNQITNLASINIKSTNDRFEENGIGLILNAGADIGANATSTSTANGNSMNLETFGSRVLNNLGTLPPGVLPPGGIFASAGNSILGSKSSDNRLEINFWGTQMFGNRDGVDINSFGARSLSGNIAGTNNITEIYLHGVSNQATVVAIPSFPLEPAGTNIINIFR